MRITHEFSAPDAEGARGRGVVAIAFLAVLVGNQVLQDISAGGGNTAPEPPPPVVVPTATPPPTP